MFRTRLIRDLATATNAVEHVSKGPVDEKCAAVIAPASRDLPLAYRRSSPHTFKRASWSPFFFWGYSNFLRPDRLQRVSIIRSL